MTARSTEEFGREDVDRLLASGGDQIRFPRAIEARYEADRAADRRRHLLIYGAIALMLFDLFLIFDSMMLPDVFEAAVLLSLAVATPLCLAVLWSLFVVRSPVYRELSQAGLSLGAIVIILYLSTVSDSPLATYYHFSVLLVVIFANVVQRLDFPYAVGMSAAALALYVPALLRIEALPDPVWLAASMLMGGGILLTLFANHRMESQLRTAYLYRLRDGLRHEELDALARVDPLTGLGNRRQLDRHLGELWDRPAGEAAPACVVLLDVDHFKKYNDRYGHPAGDLCLKRIAAIMQAELRGAADAAFRFGGEEFVAVLSGAELMDGVRVGERIRQAVEDAAIPHESNGAQEVVTVSLGAAASVPAGAISKEEIIMSADIALYAAKKAGRNQIWPPLSGRNAPVTYLSEVRSTGLNVR